MINSFRSFSNVAPIPASHVVLSCPHAPLISVYLFFCLFFFLFIFSFVQLTPGGKAAQAGVGVGDWVVSIDDTNAEDMTHVEAQNKIRAATDTLTLSLSK